MGTFPTNDKSKLKRKPLTRAEKDRRNRRERELRREKKREFEKRSYASKKGWATRRAKQAEVDRLRQETERQQAEIERLKLENERLSKIADQVERGRRELSDLFFKEETADEKRQRMLLLWRESAALVSGRGVSRYGQLLLWIERNNFDAKEFWAEYRRRTK